MRACGSRLSILIVENDDLLRESAADMVEDIGHEAFKASNADTALTFLAAGTPVDVMLVDVGLPDRDGREVGRIARELHPELHIVFVTGYGHERVSGTIAELTAAFLPKPYRLHDLQRTLEDMACAAEAGR